jgi:hypothetical protein
MRFVQISGTALAVTTLLATAAQAQTALSDPAVTLTQHTFFNVQPAVVMTNGGSAQRTLSDTTFGSIAGFDSGQGVLTGVLATLQVADPNNRYLIATNAENTNVTASLTSTWQLGAANNSTTGTLQTFDSLKDSFQSGAKAWQSISFAPTNLAAFVDQAVVTSTLKTTLTLGAPVKDVKNDGEIIYSDRFTQTAITSTPTTSGTLTPVNSLPVNISLTYSYLLHSNASFSQALDQNMLDLNFSQAGSRAVSVHALGDEHTTLLDMTGVSCTGDCTHYQLNLASFGDLVAGGAQAGDIAYLGGGGKATYTFSFSDNTAVGVTNTPSSAQTLVVNVTAVPEPHGVAMLLAGLGAIGWMSRRRRLAAKGQSLQFAKL